MHSREVIKRLKDDGWFQVAQEGDHIQFKHPTKPGRCTVPHPVKDIPAGTLGSIRRQSGLTLREDMKPGNPDGGSSPKRKLIVGKGKKA